MRNIPEFTVSQFSRAVKNLLEDSFGYVKITGEISGFKRASSGHIYFNLKDERQHIRAHLLYPARAAKATQSVQTSTGTDGA